MADEILRDYQKQLETMMEEKAVQKASHSTCGPWQTIFGDPSHPQNFITVREPKCHAGFEDGDAFEDWFDKDYPEYRTGLQTFLKPSPETIFLMIQDMVQNNDFDQDDVMKALKTSSEAIAYTWERSKVYSMRYDFEGVYKKLYKQTRHECEHCMQTYKKRVAEEMSCIPNANAFGKQPCKSCRKQRKIAEKYGDMEADYSQCEKADLEDYESSEDEVGSF